MSNILHSRTLSSSSSTSLPAAVLLSEITSSANNRHHPAAATTTPSSSSTKPLDWEADSIISESKSSSSGGTGSGKYRPAWKPRREVLNIDSIFSRERRRQAGYSPLGASQPDDCAAPASEGANTSFPAPQEVMSVRPGTSWTLPTASSSHRRVGGAAELPPPPPPPPRLIQRMESGYESSERNSSSPVSLDLNLGDRECALKKPSVSSSSSAPSWRNIRSKSSGALLQDVSSSSRGSLGMTAPPVGRSELDELQEEVLRRAKDEEQQRRQEKEREAALGFNPRPSKYLDLDQLQIQGKGDSFERCVSEAELLLDQSLRLEQAGEVAAALSAVNEAVSKLRPVASEGGASSNSRLQRCMRRARSLQQRMQLQQRPQDSVAVRQHPEQQQQEEEQQLQEQPSEKALSLQILLTNRQGDQSAAGQDQEALPLSPCVVKPLPPKTISDPAYSAVAPREDNRTRGPCSRVGKPLSNAASLPALCVDTWEQSPLESLAPPPPPEEMEFPTQWTKTSPVPIPAHALTPHSRTPSPIGTNDDCHLIMEKEPCYIRQGQTTPPLSVSPSRVAPTPPTRNWSCLHLEPHDDVVDSSHPPSYATADSPSSAPLPPVHQPDQTTSTAPAQGHRSLLPVERWAENVNRYFSFKNGEAGGGGGGGEEAPTSPCEELSELDSLYQASLLAPSMQRGSRGVSPQPTGNKPGVRRMLSGSGRSKTPTAEIERYAYRTPVTTLHKPGSGDDESYSADNLRRIARSLSGTAIGSRTQNIPASRSCDPSVSRPPLTPADLHSSTLPRRPSTSSLHLPSSSFTDPSFHHLQPRHHGPSAPASPPHHPPSQTSRPHSSGPSTWGRTGVGPSVQQQFLVVSDRHQAPSEQSLHSIALSYGTLPRAPRRAPPPFSSLTRPGAGCTAAPPPAPQSLYATLSRPRRSANTTTGTNGHYRQPSLPIKVNGSAHYPPHHIPPPHHHPQHHLRVPGEAPSQPLRLDVPPESDWRRDAHYRTVQPSSSWDPLAARHHHLSLQRTQSHQPPPHRPRRDPLLCSLCQQLPAEPPRPYCASCGAYVARFRPGS